LTGFDLPEETYALSPGLVLCRAYIEVFDSPMMAFAPPAQPNTHHPPPWVAIRGGFAFQSRVELCVTESGVLDGFTPSSTAWLVAALFRLQVQSPVRLAVLGNMPFKEMGPRWKEATAVAFESALNHHGLFKATHLEASSNDLAFVRDLLPTAARLYHHDRFFRSFSVFDEASWSPTIELSSILIWTAIETLFDLSSAQHKTKAIAQALSEFVGVSPSDRDRAYNVVRDLYEKRGRIVHVARKIEPQDFMQSVALARTAFQGVLINGELPRSKSEPRH
jgi:cell division protein ZapA (FtsZ GTPase activity inhibitor)